MKILQTRVFALSFMIFTSLIGTLVSCTTPQQLVYQDVRNFRIGKLDLTQPEIGMDLQFYNPNPFPLNLQDARIKVYINDEFLGSARLNGTFNMPALDTFLIPIALSADISNVFPSALSLVFKKEVKLRLEGEVTAARGLLRIPVYYEGTEKLHIF